MIALVGVHRPLLQWMVMHLAAVERRARTWIAASVFIAGLGGCSPDLSGLGSGSTGSPSGAGGGATTTGAGASTSVGSTGGASVSGSTSTSGTGSAAVVSSAASSSSGSTVGGTATNYRNAVIADGPVSFWHLDETSGTTAIDSIGPNNGAYLGAIMLGVPGPFSTTTAAQFNGVDTSVSVGDVFDFVGNAPYTIELWAHPDQIKTNWYHRIVSKEGSNGAGNQGWLLWVSTTGLEMMRYDDGTALTAEDDASLMAGVWSHIVATYDGTSMKLFVDGVKVSYQGGTNVAMLDVANALTFGRGPDGNGPFIGSLAEIAIYDKALAATTVVAHYTAGTQ